MTYFVDQQSIVREIWGKSDTILFIFAGASAEFALNKAVDWLYFTGRLPQDPIGRLFSTVAYAKQIVFSETNDAMVGISRIVQIHTTVEAKRHSKIPDWAYRDVLFMLIHYSIAAYELLERQLTFKEKQEVFDVFYRVGQGMDLTGLPKSYTEWLTMRKDHLDNNLERSHFTIDLFNQYKNHLGTFRYRLLLESQKLLVPPQVASLMKFGQIAYLKPFVGIYKLSKLLKLDSFIKMLVLPPAYQSQIKALDQLKPRRYQTVIS